MKIVDVKATIIAGNFDWTIVRVDTDEGISGYGETRNHTPGVMETYVSSKDLALKLKPLLVGEDPTNIELLFQMIRRFGGRGRLGGGVSAVETALWDIMGKALNVPVYRLLGGKRRNRIRIYCDCHAGKPIADGSEDYELDNQKYTPEAYAENALRVKDLGFTFVKFDLFASIADLVPGGRYENHVTSRGIDYLVSIAGALRECLGNETELGFDCAEFPTASEAIRFGKAVEEFELAFLEDLITDADVEGFRRITTSINTPTLTGEEIYTSQGFKGLIENRAISIAAPDLTTVGGIGETKKIADLAELYGIQMAPHFSGSPIGMMANVHAAAAMPNLIAVEFHAIAVPWWDSLVKGVNKSIIKDGYIDVLDEPGLGIELDEQQVRKHLKPGEAFFE